MAKKREKNLCAIDLKGEDLERYKAIHKVVKKQVKMGVRWQAVCGMVAFAEMYPDELRDQLIARNPDSPKRKKRLAELKAKRRRRKENVGKTATPVHVVTTQRKPLFGDGDIDFER